MFGRFFPEQRARLEGEGRVPVTAKGAAMLTKQAGRPCRRRRMVPRPGYIRQTP
jgi:hypothetical protein